METTTVSQNVWQKSKLIVKGLIIGTLVLLLLIPAYYVKNLVEEREERQKEAFVEVSSKWAGKQNIMSPVIVVPYWEYTTETDGKVVSSRRRAYFLPEQLDIKANVKPEKRYRGIYEVMLYSGHIAIAGKFSPFDFAQLKIPANSIIWNEAYVCMGVTDAKGLKEEIKLNINGSTVNLSPASLSNGVLKEGFIGSLPLTEVDSMKEIPFSVKLDVNGSEQLLFTPVGKMTNVQMQSTWPDPSFTGSQLPVTSDVTDSGFTAKWKSLSHTRNFPQSWKEEKYDLTASAMGADLFIPVNGYQKTLRSVKYAILCILLTFTAFFLIETTNKKSVHPLQYALIGFALILFYTLLLSFSEYVGFNLAYAIAATATVGLIAWFVKSLLQSMKLSVLLTFVLVLLYSYIFTILQLQDYALLMGSIGLFLTLAVVMFYSRKIQW